MKPVLLGIAVGWLFLAVTILVLFLAYELSFLLWNQIGHEYGFAAIGAVLLTLVYGLIGYLVSHNRIFAIFANRMWM